MSHNKYSFINGKNIDLKLSSWNEGNIELRRSPEYKFQIVLHGSELAIGHINIRLGESEKIVKYIGNIGYGVDESFRGHHYSVEACNLARCILKDNGMSKVIITCNPNNFASIKTCERLGARFINIVDVPETLDIYSNEEKQKCRFEWSME